jgi:hypothetical protein
MPTVITKGAKTAQGYGFAAKAAAAVTYPYIEDVFSTYLYTGNNSTQNIVNGIDVSTKGGMIWSKSRSSVGDNHVYDTARGIPQVLFTNGPNPSTAYTTGYDLTSFNTNGFSLGPDDYGANSNGVTYASWTFRKQAKFFDVVTYTGTGSNTTIAHNLGSVPGCIIVKRTDTTGDWQCYHSSLANTQYMVLNTTAAVATGTTRWNSTTPTSSVFSVGTDATVNASGGTYVAYLFASNAGGFGNAGTDNVITCGSFTADGSGNATVNLGYEPQWVMVKASSTTGGWYMFDTMRGISQTNSVWLVANTASAEATGGGTPYLIPTATGFTANNSFFSASTTYIYIAIRRGPMKTPTTGTSVFALGANGLGSAGGNLGNLSASDLAVNSQRAISGSTLSSPKFVFMDRLRGVGQSNTGNTTAALYSNSADAETTVSSTSSTGTGAGTNGSYLLSDIGFNSAIRNVGQGDGGNVGYAFLRAPGFFDEVCYTGTGSATTQTHNLGVVPELMIIKSRTQASDWQVYSAALANTQYLLLSYDFAVRTGTDRWNSTTPTSSVFSIGSSTSVNGSAQTYVAYLFATVASVSKVGTYTGNGTTQTIDCGFGAGGVRFVLIKRTDATGGWYTYDTARGMTTLTDPYLFMNSTSAEAATLGSVTTVSTGFALNSAILAAINVSGGSYIFLAIA